MSQIRERDRRIAQVLIPLIRRLDFIWESKFLYHPGGFSGSVDIALTSARSV